MFLFVGHPVDILSKYISGYPIFREYKSEYKQKFRPFSQYEYCGDGKFHNTSASPPSETVVDLARSAILIPLG